MGCSKHVLSTHVLKHFRRLHVKIYLKLILLIFQDKLTEEQVEGRKHIAHRRHRIQHI